MNDVIPHGEIHEVQITEKNLYAVDELLADTIYEHDFAIADFRKKLTMPSDYQTKLTCLPLFRYWKARKRYLRIYWNSSDAIYRSSENRVFVRRVTPYRTYKR